VIRTYVDFDNANVDGLVLRKVIASRFGDMYLFLFDEHYGVVLADGDEEGCSAECPYSPDSKWLHDQGFTMEFLRDHRLADERQIEKLVAAEAADAARKLEADRKQYEQLKRQFEGGGN